MGFVLYKCSGIFIGTWVLEGMGEESLEEVVEKSRARRFVDYSKRHTIRFFKFGRRNLDYVLSDGIGIGAGWGGAWLATVAMDYVEVPDWQNAVMTSALKSGGFILGKVLAQRDHRMKVFRSSIESSAGKSVVDVGVHYFVMNATDLNATESFFSAYLVTGILASVYRIARDYRNGVMK